MAPEHRVTAALLRLAGHRTPDRIAAHLEQLDVRGDHRCCSCPIAVYIKQETGIDAFVTTTTWEIVGDATPWTLPAPIGSFIRAHDRNAYPHLWGEVTA